MASSRKLGGRCVAGISTDSGRWVRPVSAREHGELEPAHYRVEGKAPEPLDVVRIPYLTKLNVPAQPENVLIDEHAAWQLIDRVEPPDVYRRLRSHLTRGPRLFGNVGMAVNVEDTEAGVDASLALVEPDADVEFFTGRGRNGRGRLRPRVGFTLRGNRYDLVLTDFEVGPLVLGLGDGVRSPSDLGFAEVGRVLISVSLAEPDGEWHQKLAAAALFLP